jgi:hypothetical protein
MTTLQPVTGNGRRTLEAVRALRQVPLETTSQSGKASGDARRRNGGTTAGTRRKQRARPDREGGPDGPGSVPRQGVIRHCWM